MKNKLKKILFIVILITNISFPQWSTNPNNNLIVGYGLNPEICSDSAGGCYITYEYETTSYPRKLALERLDRYGYKPWGDKKQIFGELPEQWQAEIIEDGEGGVIVSYEDREWIPPAYFNSKVRVQKIDSSGNFLWGLTGLRVTIDETNHGHEPIVSDGGGGCVIVWQDYNGVFRINRINKWGERVWGDSGKVLGLSTYTGWQIIRAIDGNYYVKTGEFIYRIRQNGEIARKDSLILENMLPDTEGGIVLNRRVWTGMIPKLVAQRRDSLGNNLWQQPYVEIADSLYLNTLVKVQKNNGYFYFGWSGNKNGIERIAQFQGLRSNGSKLFTEKSIIINDSTQLSISGIIPSDSNIIIVWNDHISIADTSLAQKYDTLGNKLWNEDVVVGFPAITYQSFTTDGNGGYIVGGLINNFVVVAQQINKYGILGEVITSISSEENKQIENELNLFQNFPNPFNPNTNIKFSVPKQTKIKLNLYNILGQLVQTIAEGLYEAGYYEIGFNAKDLPSGIYIYRIESSQFIQSKKMILIK